MSTNLVNFFVEVLRHPATLIVVLGIVAIAVVWFRRSETAWVWAGMIAAWVGVFMEMVVHDHVWGHVVHRPVRSLFDELWLFTFQLIAVFIPSIICYCLIGYLGETIHDAYRAKRVVPISSQASSEPVSPHCSTCVCGISGVESEVSPLMVPEIGTLGVDINIGAGTDEVSSPLVPLFGAQAGSGVAGLAASEPQPPVTERGFGNGFGGGARE